MKKSDTKITRYEAGEWHIDIVEDDTLFEAWLQNADYGVSELMCGVMKKDLSLDQFMAVVAATLAEEIEMYQNDWMDETADELDDAEAELMHRILFEGWDVVDAVREYHIAKGRTNP